MGEALRIGLIAALALSARSLDAQVLNPGLSNFPAHSELLRAAWQALVPALYREGVERLGFVFNPQADGGDGGGDGGGGDGSGTGAGGDGSGDGSGAGDGSDSSTGAGTDSSSTDSAGPGDNSDPDPDPATTDNGVAATDAIDNVAPTLAVNENATIDPATQQALDAVATPWGGVPEPIDFASGFVDEAGANPVPGAPAGTGPPAGGPGVPGVPGGVPPPGVPGFSPPGGPGGNSPGGAGEDVRINAVIVTGAVTPWGCIRKVAGIRNVYVKGSLIALGQTPLPGEPAPGSPQPKWLHLAPDLRLERGEVFPPVVPNIIDVRILYFPTEAEPAQSTEAQKGEGEQ